MNPATGENRSLRWIPTTEQVAVLEELYSRGLRNPSPSQIHQIVDHLSQHGKVQGRNVFYWFQNHKAREKQKIRQQLLRQHQEQLESFYNNTFSDSVMVPDGCSLSQQPDGVSSQVACCTPHKNVFFHQGAVMCACFTPVSTLETMLEMINPATESPCHPLALPTLDLFPATTSSLSSMRQNADYPH